jgi:hypothetical protein
MARISTYALDTNIKGTDKLIGTDVENNNVTKNFSVKELTDYISENEAADLDLVGINLRWNNDQTYSSQRTWNPSSMVVAVPRLYMEFENLTLEPGITYEVVIERFTRKRKRGATKTGYKASGMKIEDPGNTDFPYNVRPVSLPINNPEGDWYDFKFDYYFKSNFPLLSGKSSIVGHFPNNTRLPIGFRIKKTNNKGVVTYSHTLRKINLTGGTAFDSKDNAIGFSEL